MAANEKGAVLVTGASTGIGRATALHLDAGGRRVFAGVRKQSDADSLSEAGSERLTPVTLDVTDRASIATARERVEEAVGEAGLGGLVNNAGIATAGPVEHLPIEEFSRVLDVNLTGQYAVTQEFLPLIRRGRGTILFITSIGGVVASPFMSPYHAAKFGLEGLADSLRRELKPWEIDVVVVQPGSVATPIWAKGTESFEAQQPAMGPEAERLYGNQMEAMKAAIVETAERGIEPERVARVIESAVASPKPKTRYLVGTDARLMRRLSRLIGDRNFDRLMRRSMKLPAEPPPES
jgi:NAD(P)-dependent dehydrogenase (short-subunit alcohol dehydrogenase family)